MDETKLKNLKTSVDLVTKYLVGCGDNSCYFKKPSVGTNGGCRCLKTGAKIGVAPALGMLYRAALEITKEE